MSIWSLRFDFERALIYIYIYKFKILILELQGNIYFIGVWNITKEKKKGENPSAWKWSYKNPFGQEVL